MHLTHVHEIQNCSQYLTLDAIDEKHRMWTWIFLQIYRESKKLLFYFPIANKKHHQK